MISDHFLKVLQFFVNFTRCSNDRKVLLILDNHQSHISIEATTFAKENGFVLLTIPPHTFNKLEPLDFFGPFKTFVSQGINDWMISNPGKIISTYDLPLISSTAWNKAATPINTKGAFYQAAYFLWIEIFFQTKISCALLLQTDHSEVTKSNVRIIQTKFLKPH